MSALALTNVSSDGWGSIDRAGWLVQQGVDKVNKLRNETRPEF